MRESNQAKRIMNNKIKTKPKYVSVFGFAKKDNV